LIWLLALPAFALEVTFYASLASDRIRARDGTSDHGEYYDHFLRALEKLLEEKGIAHTH